MKTPFQPYKWEWPADQARIRELTEALESCVEVIKTHQPHIRAIGCGCCESALEQARKALGEAGQQ